MFVIAGASGHTGSVVASTLLAQGKKVRVIVRDEKKGTSWKARGAEVAIADLDDAAALGAALRGADGVYALVPPNYTAEDPAAAQARTVESWSQAIAAAKPKHVVVLSSIGADLPAGTGPIAGLHRLEERLAATGVPFTALRASYFMENWGGVAPAAKGDGVLPSMLKPGRAAAMVATADIGRVAAELLVEGAAAPRVVELSGPRDYAPEDVAAAFANGLGRPIKLVPVAEASIEGALQQAGFTPKLAALFREMTVALNRGQIKWTGTPRRGRVDIDEVVRGLVA